jgi:hypothetical protein
MSVNHKNFVIKNGLEVTNGQVGIGTNSPSDKLHVVGDIRVEDSDPTIKLIDSDGTLQNSHIHQQQANLYFDLRNNTGDGTLIVRGMGGGSGTEKLRLNSNGQVGIGFNFTGESTDSKLSVEGVTAITNLDQTVMVRDSNNDGAVGRGGNIGFSAYVDGDMRTLAAIGGVKEDTGTSFDGNLVLYTRRSGQANLDERLRITSDGKVRVPDNGKFTAGAGDDLKIYHDGTDSRVENSTGDIKLKNTGSYYFFDEDGGETLASFINDGSVNLYHDGNKKFETSSTGVTVTGNLVSDGISLGDSEKVNFGAGDDLQIYHTADTESVIHDNGTGPLKIRTNKLQIKSSTDSATIAEFKSGTNGVDLYFDNSKKIETTSTGATVTGTALATALSTGASGTGINISTNTISGPATLTLDPAGVGDNTGTVIIAGDLQIDGTTTTINSTTLTVDDKNIVLASGAANAAAADGAGITIDGADATLLYKSTPDAWSFNKNVGIGTDAPVTKLQVAGNLTVGPLNTTDQYQGILLINGKDSSSAETISFIDGRNDLGIPDSDIWMAHETDGGSYIRFATTPLGSRSSDRRQERLRIDSSGNVGIGTDTPSERLEVDGVILSSGPIVDTVWYKETWPAYNETTATLAGNDLGTWTLTGGTLATGTATYAEVDTANLPSGLKAVRWKGEGTSAVSYLTSPTVDLSDFRTNEKITTINQTGNQADRSVSDSRLYLTVLVAAQSLDSHTEHMEVQLSNDNGVTFHEHQAFVWQDNDADNDDITDTTWRKVVIDISEYTYAPSTASSYGFKIRFMGTGTGTGDNYGVSNIYIHDAPIPNKLKAKTLKLGDSTLTEAGDLDYDEFLEIISAPDTFKGLVLNTDDSIRDNYVGVQGADSLVLASDELNAGNNSRIDFRIDGKDRMKLYTSTNDGAAVAHLQLIGHTTPTDRSKWRITAADDGTNGKFSISDYSGSSWNENLVILENGNVGIGTAVPDGKLHVKGTIRLDGTSTAINNNFSRIYQNSSSTIDYGLQLRHYQGDTGNVDASISIGGNGSTREDNIVFYRSNGSGASTETMRIDENGNVGIGTDDPDTSLHIKDGTASPMITLENPNDNTAVRATYIRHKFDDGFGGEILCLRPSGAAATGAEISFRVGGVNVANQKMVIKSSGNVGIGTTSPSDKLQVDGSIKIVAAAPIIKLAETGVTGNPSWWIVQDGGNFSLRNNNTTPYAFQVVTKGTNKDETSYVSFGGDTIQDALTLTAHGTNPTYLDIKGNNANARMRYYEGATDRWNIGYDTSIDAFTFYDSENSATRVVFKDGGNVGIGTPSPDSKLHVYGTQNAGGILVEDSSTSTQAPAITVIGKRSDANNGHSFSGKLLLARNYTGGKITSNITLGTLGFGGNHTNGTMANILYAASIHGIAEDTFDSATDMPTALTFHTGATGRNGNTNNVKIGTEKLRITSTGNVGIGTTAPSAKLQVTTANTTYFKLTSSTLGDRVVVDQYACIGLDTAEADIVGRLHVTTASDHGIVVEDVLGHTVFVADDGSSRVGVGTLSPTGLFEVESNNGADPVHITRGGSVSTDQVSIKFKATTTRYFGMSGGDPYWHSSNNISLGENLFQVVKDIALGSSDNLNSLTDGYYTWTTPQPTNSPGNPYMAMLQLSDNNQKIQMAFGSSSNGRLYVRRADSGTFYTWTEFARINETSNFTATPQINGNDILSTATGLSTNPSGTIYWSSNSLSSFDPPGGGTGTDTATDVALGLASGNRIAGWFNGYIRTLLEWNSSGDITIGQGATTMIGGINLIPGTSGLAKVNGEEILTKNSVGEVNNIIHTSDGEHDITLFGAKGGAAQSGAFNSKLIIKGGSSQTRTLELFQDASGYATINTSYTDNYLDFTGFNRLRLNQQLDLNGNNIIEVEDIGLRDKLYHDGDTNTYIQFQSGDQWRVVTGGVERLEVNNTQTTINQNATVNGAITIGGSSVSTTEGGEIRLTKPTNQTTGDTYIDLNSANLRFFHSTSPNKGAYINLSNCADAVGSRILTTSDEGSGNGLDSDTVDGIQGTSITQSLARFTGWVPTYTTSSESAVTWNYTENTVEIKDPSGDSSIGAAYKAVKLKSGDKVRINVQAKGSVADTDGFYLRLYFYNGTSLPDGKTHVSHNASHPLVQEDSSGDTGWHENGSISTSYVSYSRDYTAAADGYLSIVILNWTGYTGSIYVKEPIISVDTGWHAGNMGADSTLDADKLDGQHGSYYQNATNLTSGTIPDARITDIGDSQARIITFDNLEKSDLTADGQLSFDSSQGLLVYRVQQGTSGATTTVLDGWNVAAGTGISITNLGAGDTATGEFTFSLANHSAALLTSGTIDDARIPDSITPLTRVTTAEVLGSNTNLTISATGSGKDLYLKGADNVFIEPGREEDGCIYFRGNSGTDSYRFAKSGQTAIEGFLSMQSLTADRTFTFPDQGGTIALTTSYVSRATTASRLSPLSDGSSTVSTQGMYTQWNRVSGTGSSYFINQKGAGGGGWRFLSTTTSNVDTAVLFIEEDGRVTIQGSDKTVVADTFTGTASGNLPLTGGTLTGDLTVPGKILHAGDDDTYIQFDAANRFRVVCQGAEVQEWGNNYTLINDNDTLRLGTGSDFQMKFNGADTVFKNHAHANGDIIFQGENSAGTSQNILIMKTDGTRTYNVLYENSAERFRTTSTGVKVTGVMDSTSSVNIGGELNLIGTSDSNKNIDCRVGSNALSIRKTTGGDAGHETMARFVGDGAVELYHNNVKKFETTSTGASVVGGLTTTGAVTIAADNQETGALRILANQTNPTQNYYFAQEIESTLSGSNTFTGDHHQGGLWIDVDSTATGGGTSHEHRAYGIFVDLDVTGDADNAYAIYADSTVTPTTGTVTNVTGVYGRAEDNGGAGAVTNVIGVKGEAVSDNSNSDINNMYGGYFKSVNIADTGNIAAAHGCYAEIEIPNNTGDHYDKMYVFRAEYDDNDDVAQTGTSYLYYGNYAGTNPTTAFGVHIADNVKNYFGGDIGIGTDAPGSKLHTNGTRDYTGSTPSTSSYDNNFQSGTAVLAIGQSNGIPAIQGFGTGTAYHLVLAPNNGNVGIGTSGTPVAKLDVNGNIHCTKLAAGTSSNPGANLDICLGADNDTGFSCPADGELKIWSNNTEVALFKHNGIVFTDQLTTNGRLNVRGHLDLSDGENLDFGSSDDVRINYNSNNWLYTNFRTGNGIVFQDNGTDKIILEDSGIIRPSVTNTGTIGTSDRYWDNGYFQDFNVSGTINVRGAIDLADNDILRLGSGDDAELFCDGSHLYLDLNSGIGNFYIKDGSTTRYTFNDNGNFTATGNVTAYSDIKLKENIEPIANPLDKVNQINGVTFDRIDTPELGRQMGVIAQDVEKVCPELVSTDEEGTKSVAYGNMVGLLIEAIKDQQKQIDELKAKLEEK